MVWTWEVRTQEVSEHFVPLRDGPGHTEPELCVDVAVLGQLAMLDLVGAEPFEDFSEAVEQAIAKAREQHDLFAAAVDRVKADPDGLIPLRLEDAPDSRHVQSYNRKPSTLN
jgi:hypothetical protein